MLMNNQQITEEFKKEIDIFNNGGTGQTKGDLPSLQLVQKVFCSGCQTVFRRIGHAGFAIQFLFFPGVPGPLFGCQPRCDVLKHRIVAAAYKDGGIRRIGIVWEQILI